jgi:hypothetical protein
VGRVPTKFIRICKGGGGQWVQFLYATLEELKANYEMRHAIGRAVVAKADEMLDVIELMEAEGANTPFELTLPPEDGGVSRWTLFGKKTALIRRG